MKPVIVMPLFDPKGNLFPRLQEIAPQLKELFERAIISVPPSTKAAQPECVQWAESDPFFHVIHLPDGLTVGKEFALLYRQAAELCPPQQVIHLAYPDRVAFALQTDLADTFCADVQQLTTNDLPLCFERSLLAWQTHPQNYYEMESVMTKAGQYLLGRRLDFGWCHLVVTANDLEQVMPQVNHPGIAMVAQLILALGEMVQNRPVDWLSWEDPFIEGVDAVALKAAREQDPAETQKRLGYVIPALQMISDAAE